MRNRKPRKPGRVKITPESEGAPFYAKMEMADDPSDEGTPYNVESVLKDSTATALGFQDPKNTDLNDVLFAFRNAVSFKNNELKTMEGKDASTVCVKSAKGTGVYPVRYSLPFAPKFAIMRGWASGNKTAVSLIFPGAGVTVTQVDKSAFTANYQMRIDGDGILIAGAVGGEIAGAHNVLGKFESIVAFR